MRRKNFQRVSTHVPNFNNQLRDNQLDYLGMKQLELGPTFPDITAQHIVTFNRSIAIYSIRHWNGATMFLEFDRIENLVFGIQSTSGVVGVNYRVRLANGNYHDFAYPIWTRSIKIKAGQSGGNSSLFTIWYI